MMNTRETIDVLQRKKAKVLVVDDDKLSRLLIFNMMKRNQQYFDIEIDEAINGLEGLEKINTGDYDVVFLDYNMPIMNGIDCLKGITTENKPNVIMVTAVESNGDEAGNVQKLAYENAVYNFIKKPIDSFSVVQIGKNAINDAISKRELREREKQLTETLGEIHETKERIDSILDRFLSHETLYLESINNRKFPLFVISVFQKPYDRGSGDIFMHNKFRERHILCFSLFDVSGHSLETSVDAQHVKLLRMSEMSHPVKNRPYLLDELALILNDKIKKAFTNREKYTYSTYAEVRFNMESNILEVVNCGSEPPILIRKNGVVEKFKSQTAALGMVGNTEFSVMFKDYVMKTKFERGDWFFMSSDGFVEAEDEKGLKFINIIQHIVRNNTHLGVEEMRQLLIKYYIEHTGSDAFGDDITFALMKIRDDYEKMFIDFRNNMTYIKSQLELTPFFEDIVSSEKIAMIRDTLFTIIQDVHAHNINAPGFLLEYKLISNKRCVEVIIDLGMTQCNIDYIDRYMKEEENILAHLIEKTGKMLVMKEGKKVILNFVY